MPSLSIDLQIHHSDESAIFEHRDDFRRDARGFGQVILRPFQQLARVAALPWSHVEVLRCAGVIVHLSTISLYHA